MTLQLKTVFKGVGFFRGSYDTTNTTGLHPFGTDIRAVNQERSLSIETTPVVELYAAPFSKDEEGLIVPDFSKRFVVGRTTDRSLVAAWVSRGSLPVFSTDKYVPELTPQHLFTQQQVDVAIEDLAPVTPVVVPQAA